MRLNSAILLRAANGSGEMKAAILGSGMMGSVIARDLARSSDVDSVVVADVSDEGLRRVRRSTPGRKLTTEHLDVRDREKAVRFLRRFDVVSSALPHGAVNAANQAAVYAGAKMVDIAFEDSQMRMNGLARRKGATLVPGCGLAPGLGGILLTQAVSSLDEADEGHILVGGLPQHPEPPFGYRLVFSIVGLLREYLDDARVVRDGRVVRVKPFSRVEEVAFPAPIGKLEAFCTDGLGTLLYTMKGVRDLDEKTLRWPGHAEKMRFLIDAGYLSDKEVEVDGSRVSPLRVSHRVLSDRLARGGPEDVTVMRVEAKGKKGGKARRVSYEMLDFYDPKSRMTSMGRTTGFTCSIVSQMVGRGEVEGGGVLPPESALKGTKVATLLSELARRGVVVKRSGP